MKGYIKTEKKEKTKASNAHEYSSGFNLMTNILNRPYQHHHPRLPSTSTAHEQMQAMSTPSSSAPKQDGNDVMVSSLPSDFAQMQVGHSRPGPSASTLGDTTAITDPTTLEHKSLNKEVQKSRISATITIGQGKAFGKVCDFLTRSEVGMVGIYGMGGVGKTTLMTKVCNEFLKPSNFKVVWIVVSKTVNENNIQKSLMRKLNLSFDEDQIPQERGMDIKEALFDSKHKVALLLDDIWEAINLEQLGVAGSHGLDTSMFKIIFTTRSKDVCLKMDPDQKMKIECLGPEESWALFKRSVGEKTLNSHYGILGLAKEVAKECAGLPLALTVIGKAMVCKTSLGAWEDALKNLRDRPSLISGAKKDLFERLKLSYDNLEHQVERECFLFCCMYPEDQEIDKNQLFESWIGGGLLDVGYGTYQEACNRGHGIIDTLVATSLLGVGCGYPPKVMIVKMHDIIRDMGLLIDPKNYFVHTDSLKINREEIAKRWNGARHVYVEGYNDDLPQELDCPNLSSLQICPVGGRSRCITISKTFWNSMNFLHKIKVLIINSLRFTSRHGIPTLRFELLVELRHLEISDSIIQMLPPDIGNLKKLLALILLCSHKQTRLPPTIGGLCELRKLQISTYGDHLMNIPSELGKLKKLEIVDIYTHGNLKMDNILNQCAELRKLHLVVKSPTMLSNVLLYNLNKLEELHIEFDGLKWVDKLWKEGLRGLTSLKVLTMGGWLILDGDEVIYAIGAMRQLRELRIIRADIDKLVIPTAPDNFLPQLEVLEIKDCNRLEKVHFRKRALQSLCVLKLRDCNTLAHVVGLQHLLQLRELEIFNLRRFKEELITTDVDEHCSPSDVQTYPVCFPNLQCLRFKYCDKMKRICNDDVSFPSLSEFNLYYCPMLKKLPQGLMNENRTTPMISGVIKGTEEWWEGLEWEDDAFKSYLRPLFVVE